MSSPSSTSSLGEAVFPESLLFSTTPGTRVNTSSLDGVSWPLQCPPGLLAVHLSSETTVCLQVRELEAELESEVRRNSEAQRGAHRLERCVRELTHQVLREAAACLPGCILPQADVLLQA